MKMKKLYAVVINTIPKSYQSVQLGHAVGKIASKNPDIDWDQQTFVYLESGVLKMHKLMNRLKADGVDIQCFSEPDIGDKLTAFACITDDYEPFK